MTSKRIICAVTNDLTYDRRMVRICTTLAEAGYTVTLVGRKFNNSSPFSASGYKGVRLSCWFTKGIVFYAEYNIRLFCYLLFTSFDIVCACDLDTALPVRWAAAVKGKKSTYDAHEYYTESPEIVGRPAVKRIWEKIGYVTVPGFDARYTVGEQIAVLLKTKYGVPFDIIRNIAPYTAPPVHPIPITQRDNIILYQGAINIGRGLEILIEAMQQLEGWECWLAGEGDITQALKQQAAALGLEDRVRFLGWVKPEALPDLMQQAKLSVNLRDKASMNDYYSLPNKFFDAIHAGLPSINMNYPEYKAVCDTYPVSFLLDELTVDAIRNVIHTVETDPMLLVTMSKACADAAQTYTWNKEAQKLLTIYRSLDR